MLQSTFFFFSFCKTKAQCTHLSHADAQITHGYRIRNGLSSFVKRVAQPTDQWDVRARERERERVCVCGYVCQYGSLDNSIPWGGGVGGWGWGGGVVVVVQSPLARCVGLCRCREESPTACLFMSPVRHFCQRPPLHPLPPDCSHL